MRRNLNLGMGPAERALLGAQHNVYNRIFIKIYCCRALATPEETSVVVNADAKPSRAGFDMKYTS